MSIIAVGVCLIVELIMLVCAMTLGKPRGVQNGIGVLFQGKCSKVQRLSTLLAIPLNIIGTILIATSNYGRSIPMQYLRIRPPFPLSSHQVQMTPQDNTRQLKRKNQNLYLLTFLLPTHLSCCSRCCILCTTACSQACSQLLSGRNLLSLARL
jgi:hypothetical protein